MYCKTKSCVVRDACKISVLFVIFSIQLLAQAPNFGIPDVKVYNKEDYDAGIQSWECEILPNGNMLFANNSGLLVYNGQNWSTYALPRKTICRSLAVDKHANIFVGGQDEVGFFRPNEKGNLIYHDIQGSIPSEFRQLNDVWDMISHNDEVFFRSNEKVFIYENNETICLNQFNSVSFLDQTNEEVFFQVFGQGLYKIENKEAIFIPNSEVFADKAVTSINFLESSSYLVSTLANGLYILDYAGVDMVDVKYNDFLWKNRVNDILKIKNDSWAISTERAGILVVDSDLKAISIINKSKGLTSNTINCMSLDQSGDLWLGLAYGINQIMFSKGIQRFYPDGKEQGSIYDIEEFQNRLYFGTNNGVYSINKQDYYDPFESLKFNFIKNSEGQVWGLDIINDVLFMGHNDGAFYIQGDKAIPFSSQKGYWKFVKIGNDRIAAGSYLGIDIFQLSSNGPIYDRSINNFSESSRIIEIDKEGFIWVSHPYRGVFRINPFTSKSDNDIQVYGKDKGLPSDLLNFIFKIKNVIYATGETGIYKFNPALDRFEIDEVLNSKIDSSKNIRRLFEHANNEVWYVAEHELGRLIPGERVGEEGFYNQKWTQIHTKMVGGFENLFLDNQQNLFVSTNRGVMLLNYSDPIVSDSLFVNFDNVHVPQLEDPALFSGYSSEHENGIRSQKNFELSADITDIKFHFSSNSLDPDDKIQYSYFLEGADKGWSNWSSTVSEKEYTQLNYGDYEFKIKAKRNDVVSEISSFNFSIEANWYETKTAYIIWAIIFFGLLASLFYLLNNKYAKETDILREDKEKKEEEIEALKSEKLQNELEFRDKELALSTMNLVQKNETINKLRMDLESLYGNLNDAKIRKDIRKILGTINDDSRLEDEWENFAIYFDRVHTNFLQRLNKEYPKLTNKDLKLSAYLRMNLNTKEIAPLLNISVRGVEVSRYRLRKKIELNPNVNLNEFMMSF